MDPIHWPQSVQCFSDTGHGHLPAVLVVSASCYLKSRQGLFYPGVLLHLGDLSTHLGMQQAFLTTLLLHHVSHHDASRHDVFLGHGLPQIPIHCIDHFCGLLLPNDEPIVCQSEAAKIKIKNWVCCALFTYMKLLSIRYLCFSSK